MEQKEKKKQPFPSSWLFSFISFFLASLFTHSGLPGPCLIGFIFTYVCWLHMKKSFNSIWIPPTVLPLSFAVKSPSILLSPSLSASFTLSLPLLSSTCLPLWALCAQTSGWTEKSVFSFQELAESMMVRSYAAAVRCDAAPAASFYPEPTASSSERLHVLELFSVIHVEIIAWFCAHVFLQQCVVRQCAGIDEVQLCRLHYTLGGNAISRAWTKGFVQRA